MEVRLSNMVAAKGTLYSTLDPLVSITEQDTAISDAVRTSLGPRGMDKMVRIL